MPPSAAMPPAASRRLPLGDEMFLDHVGHFVRPRRRKPALARVGFAPTPASVQVNPDPKGGPPQPTGTGNVTAMLARGYLEVLFKTAEMPLGHEFDYAMERYAGVQLIAVAIAEAQKQHKRLSGSGFRMRAMVDMQRPVDTAAGPVPPRSRWCGSRPAKCWKGVFRCSPTTPRRWCGSRAG